VKSRRFRLETQLALLLCLGGPLHALTLQEARALLGANPAVTAARHEVEARRAEQRAAAGLYLPRIEATARETRIDAPVELDVDPIRHVILKLHPNVPAQAVPPFIIHVQDEQFSRAAITATQPLFTGGRITAANRAAAQQVRQAEAEEEGTRAGLETELVRRYFALALAFRARDVRASVVTALEEHASHAARLQEEGLIAKAERLNADVALAEAQRALAKSANDVALARAALANLLGTDADALDPSTPLFVLDAAPPREPLLARMEQAQPVLLRLRATRLAASAGVQAERAAMLPSLYAFGSRELNESDLTVLDSKWAAGVGLNYTLFDGLQRGHRTAAAVERVRRVEALEEKARRDLEMLVDREWLSLDNALAQYRALVPAEERARENVRVRELAFGEGVGTSLEVIDARLALSRVQLERLAAAYECDVALAALLEASAQTGAFESYRAGGIEVE
jgi:outer membrane protein TolC